ncbi:MAG TPA: hypothetical protein VHO70_17075 [Chitinispirillaceae bacterium]|nr:hypothetical protein [Chitinispirillaceae bacterium]
MNFLNVTPDADFKYHAIVLPKIRLGSPGCTRIGYLDVLTYRVL